MTNRDNILEKAKEIINGDRQGTYGKPEDSFQMISELWSSYLKCDVSSVDVANMMVLLKVARNAGGVYKDDNWIDICGYAALGGEIQGRYTEENFGQYMNEPASDVEEEKHKEMDTVKVIRIWFDQYTEAARLLDAVREEIYLYGVCTVEQFYDIYFGDHVRHPRMAKYGWRDVPGCDPYCEIGNKNGRWYIDMPDAIRIAE